MNNCIVKNKIDERIEIIYSIIAKIRCQINSDAPLQKQMERITSSLIILNTTWRVEQTMNQIGIEIPKKNLDLWEIPQIEETPKELEFIIQPQTEREETHRILVLDLDGVIGACRNTNDINLRFLEYIADSYSNLDIIVSGSNRQTCCMDQYNYNRNKNFLGFYALASFCMHLSNLINKEIIFYPSIIEDFLLKNAFSYLEFCLGAVATVQSNHLNQQAQPPDKQSLWKDLNTLTKEEMRTLTYSKIFILVFWAHFFRAQENGKLILSFFDDRDNFLFDAYQFLGKFPNILPKDVEINFLHWKIANNNNPLEVKHLGTCSGTGSSLCPFEIATKIMHSIWTLQESFLDWPTNRIYPALENDKIIDQMNSISAETNAKNLNKLNDYDVKMWPSIKMWPNMKPCQLQYCNIFFNSDNFFQLPLPWTKVNNEHYRIKIQNCLLTIEQMVGYSVDPNEGQQILADQQELKEVEGSAQEIWIILFINTLKLREELRKLEQEKQEILDLEKQEILRLEEQIQKLIEEKLKWNVLNPNESLFLIIHPDVLLENNFESFLNKASATLESLYNISILSGSGQSKVRDLSNDLVFTTMLNLSLQLRQRVKEDKVSYYPQSSEDFFKGEQINPQQYQTLLSKLLSIEEQQKQEDAPKAAFLIFWCHFFRAIKEGRLQIQFFDIRADLLTFALQFLNENKYCVPAQIQLDFYCCNSTLIQKVGSCTGNGEFVLPPSKIERIMVKFWTRGNDMPVQTEEEEMSSQLKMI